MRAHHRPDALALRVPHPAASECGEMAHAIRSMQVRGAPLIGAAAALWHGHWRWRPRPPDANLKIAGRITGQHAADRGQPALGNRAHGPASAGHCAARPARKRHGRRRRRSPTKTSRCNHAIGSTAGVDSQGIARLVRAAVNVLTHCNAGWLATVDMGTALAPIYLAHDQGIPVHVWVDETRPRNQGLLTAWELAQHGVPQYVDRRQCRRAPDAARPGGNRDRRAQIASRRAATFATRSAPI